MGRWFRLDDDVVNDPKVQNLPDPLFRAWINILCIASKNDGVLPPLRDIAFTLRMKESAAGAMLSKLHLAGLLDKTEVSFKPHNWEGRQFKSDRDATAAERAKRYRDGKRDVTDTVTRDASRDANENVTPPRDRTDTETEAEKKEPRASAPEFDHASEFESQFWPIFPNRVGKKDALRAFVKARKSGASVETIVSGVNIYIQTKPPDRSWMNPATFLNGARWNDQPAKASIGNETTQSKPGSLLAAIDRELARSAAQDANFAAPANAVLSIPDRSVYRS